MRHVPGTEIVRMMSVSNDRGERGAEQHPNTTMPPLCTAGASERDQAVTLVCGLVRSLYVLADSSAGTHFVTVLPRPGSDVLKICLGSGRRRRSFARFTTGHLFCVLDPERKLFVKFVCVLQVQIDPVLVATDTEFDGFPLPLFDDRSVDIIDHLDESLARHVRTSNRQRNVLIDSFYHRVSPVSKE